MNASACTGEGWAMEALPCVPLHEVVAFTAPPAAWPPDPGRTLRDAQGLPVAWHFAPRRWLVVGNAVEMTQAATFGAAAEVSGKWNGFVLTGPRAARLLAATIAADAVLEGRECAAVHLFDCPCLLARHGKVPGAYVIYVQASYAAHFIACAQAAALRD